MTPQQLAELASVFDAEPSFEFLSPEGTAGYPTDLLELDVQDIQEMITRSEEYAREVKALNEPPAESSALS